MSSRARSSLATLALGLLAALLLASPASAAFGIASLDGGAFDSLGAPVSQAGSHPNRAGAALSFNTVTIPFGSGTLQIPAEDAREIATALPPGLIGNPTAAPTCPAAGFLEVLESEPNCPREARLGIATLTYAELDKVSDAGVYNLEPAPGTAAKFGFIFAGVPVVVEASLNPIPPYNATVRATGISQIVPLFAADFEIWGVPASAAHDAERWPPGPSAEAGDPKPFLSLPTSCNGPVRTDVTVTSWLGSSDSSSFLSHDAAEPTPNPLPITGCEALEFAPSLQTRPTTDVADSPSGLDVELHVPQSEDPDGTAEAHLKDATVTLPEGLVVNPAGANGLGACAPAQIGLSAPGPASCPDDSKLASVQVDTPLLDHPVAGATYIATPYENPFNSLLALYIALDDPQTGTVVKLAGQVHADPNTGRLTATFEENPQVPFEDFTLHFKGGAHGTLRTPPTCGAYSTTSSLTPWSAPASGPPASPSDEWSISRGPGGHCASSPAEQPNSPAFDAGTVSPIAAHYSPFVLHLRREDGSQNFAAINLTPPPGLVAKLAGTATCSDAALAAAAAKSGRQEQAGPSCPAASRVGTVSAAAGAGPAPYHAPGTAYLSGPYKGAPLSLAIVTPAVAGPFDLGTIVVRTALYVDSKTARITAVSDPIPQILQGIPLDVRSIDVALDRPQFTLNPTSCDPSAVGGQLISSLGLTAPLSARFQLAECTRLGFKPKMRLSLKGATKRGSHPALTAVLKPRAGDANIASVSVALPRSEFLDQAHIGTVCTRVQFAADACPAASVYGEATVQTPLFDYPLAGHVYLRSSNNLLPDLVPDLRGPAYQPIKVEAAGRTDSIHGGIRNSFEFVPDAPFSRLVVKLRGGGKGLLVNSRDICQKPYRATVTYTAHNGLAYVDHPVLAAKCPKRGQRKKHRG